MLAVECDPARIEKRLATRYLDRMSENLDDALALMEDAAGQKTPLSVGLLGNAADVFAELAKRRIRPDAVTDQTVRMIRSTAICRRA